MLATAGLVAGESSSEHFRGAVGEREQRVSARLKSVSFIEAAGASENVVTG
jgi:hypothetical protein